MRDEVPYRGPDDYGSAFFTRKGSALTEVAPSFPSWAVGLGHRRLSILDLSPTGHQPMAYGDQYWIVYNGEVYNYVELRTELQRLGHVFCSTSDTEVILAAYAEWGTDCFAQFRGMWGLVILDCDKNEIVLCRDRLGIKPLYLWKGPEILAVASEIKQFLKIPGFTPRLNPAAAAEYLQTGYEDPERSFFQNVQPIRAGSFVRIPLDTLTPSTPEEYWHPERVHAQVTDAKEASQLFLQKARECVRIHLRSDVPVGCALSGGLDSSSIALLINELRNGEADPLHTFSVTFPGHPVDEREYADAVIANLRASPHYVTPDPNEFLEDLDRFLWVQDEPVGSFSMYAGYCLSRLTREWQVPVTLNGQGGDEILSGDWETYFLHLRDLWKQRSFLDLVTHFAGALAGGGNPALVNQVPTMLRRYCARINPPLPVRFQNTAVRNNGAVLKNVLALDPQVRRLREIRVMFLPQLLKWDDRNAMAFSIESRYPFLDHELIELCLSFAPETLYRYGWTKYPLRLGLNSILPSKVRDRRSKFGFLTPQDSWLCGSLRPQLDSWLKTDRPIWGYVERPEIERMLRRIWDANAKRDEDCKDLFRIFAFDRWLDVFGVQN
jgi:asparagine synthase (glutamine-hydrolysing)